MPRFHLSSIRASILGSLGLLAATASAITPAAAHAVLIASQPPSGGTVAPGSTTIHLRYNSRVDRERSRLTLTRPDHSQAALPIAQDHAPPDEINATAKLTPGDYVLRWQVLAIDGHITRGDVPFTVGH